MRAQLVKNHKDDKLTNNGRLNFEEKFWLKNHDEDKKNWYFRKKYVKKN